MDDLVEDDRVEIAGPTSLAMASYLIYNGCEDVELEWTRGNCNFYFPESSGIHKLVQQYVTGKARVEPNSYSVVLADLRRQMFSARPADQKQRRRNG